MKKLLLITGDIATGKSTFANIRHTKNIHLGANKRNFAYRYPKGESMMQLAYRIYGFLEDIKEKYAVKNV